MRRLIIIVEGDTEKEFVNKTLSPYLSQRGIYTISCYKITKTNGGLVSYSHLRKDILKAINEKDVFVTTLIDYYALPDDFPGYNQSLSISDKQQRVSFLENAITEEIQKEKYFPFLLPYIQLHEFEALLFTSLNGFRNNFNDSEADFSELEKIMELYNPEEINNNKETAPSNRLKKIIPSYRKIVFGNIIIEDNGIHAILEKCPRFKNWIDNIIQSILPKE